MKPMWEQFFNNQKEKLYFKELMDKVEAAYASNTVYPPKEDLWRAFEIVDVPSIKVVILGQDPYHQPSQAHGLSFSVNPKIKVPPSLKNIYKELNSDLGIEIPNHGYLMSWAMQGVLLLNATLSVEHGKPRSHQKFGWEQLTDEVIRYLDTLKQPIVFVLWGNDARKKKSLISNSHHLVIEGVHPSPLSSYQGFFGSKPFSTINDFLISNGMNAIDWRISNV